MPMLDLDPANAGDIGNVKLTERPRLSPLEWAAVAVARHDGFTTLHEPSRMAKAISVLFNGSERDVRLADGHLEELRRAAAYAWHGVPSLPDDEELSFHSAGFTLAHYDLPPASVLRADAG